MCGINRLSAPAFPLTAGILVTAVGFAGAGSLVLRRLLTCMLAGFVMADHTASTSAQHAVVTREVARYSTTAAPFRQPAAFAAEDVMPAITARAKTAGIKFLFILLPLSQELTNYLDDKQMNPKKIPCPRQLSTNLSAKSSLLLTTVRCHLADRGTDGL